MGTPDTLKMVEFKELTPHEDNIRYELRGIEDLAKSIENAGLQTPLRVRENHDGSGYTILAGHRRYAALTQLGTKGDTLIPAMITTNNGENDFVTMLVENLQREGIDPMEEAAGITRLTSFGIRQADIATKLGVSPTFVSARVQLSKLPESLHYLVRDGIIPLDTAVELAKVVKDLPEDVIDTMTSYDNPFTAHSRIRSIISATKRKKVIGKGTKVAVEAGLQVRDDDEPVPDGKRIVWVSPVDSPDELDDEVTEVQVLYSPEGNPMYRPVVLEDVEVATNGRSSEAEERAQNRAYKADHLEFWQGTLGSRPKKADVVRDVIHVLIAQAGTNQFRIASKMLRLEEVKVSGYDDKLTTDWQETWLSGYEKNQTTGLLALVAAFAENASGIHYEPEWANQVRENWDYDGLTSNSEID